MRFMFSSVQSVFPCLQDSQAESAFSDGPTGGYIIGFLFTALIVGLMTDFLGRKLWVLAVSMVAGLAVCYLFGTIWFMIAMHTEFVAALLTCVVPFLLADAAKIVVATVLVNRLDKIVKL